MTFTPPGAEHHLERLGREALRFSDAPEGLLSATVAACPGWDVRDLVRHVGMVHGWCAGNVAALAPMRAEVELSPPDDDTDLLAWAGDQAAELLEVLGRTDPSAPMWTHVGAGTASYWFRRMAHETGVHLLDLRDACSEAASMTALDAADGVDEFLHVYATARDRHGHLNGDGEQLWLRAPDAEALWHVTSTPAGGVIERPGLDEAVGAPLVTAPALALLRMVWGRGRLTPETATGDDVTAALMVGRLRQTAI